MIDAKYILDIKSIPDLDVFKFTEGEGLEIGANVTVNEAGGKRCVSNPSIGRFARAASVLATEQLRNRANPSGQYL